ncbi:MAG: DUF4386 domain-containing protein [Candidatus Delongbacteria bacterium]|nr:DUF4386 domain-containing protein [Candidatus Delongbacteria bacterium]
MTTNTILLSQRKAAIVAGLTLIFSIAIVVISNYSVNFRFIVQDVAETARNIIAHETLFRFNIFCNLIYLVTLILMSASLYEILKPINRNLAIAAGVFRVVYASMWGIIALNTFGAIHILGNASYLPVFNTDQLHTLMMLNLNSSWDAYYVALPFWGLASLVCSYLLLRSKYIPKTLATFGLISSAWCVFCAFTYLIFPSYGKVVHLGWFDVPMTFFEIILGFWLLFKRNNIEIVE